MGRKPGRKPKIVQSTKEKKFFTHCQHCGKPLSNSGILQKFCNRSCYLKYRANHPNDNQTLCWTCKHTNQFECSWFTVDMIPVPGWKAIKRPTADGLSYLVVECPNYKRDERK